MGVLRSLKSRLFRKALGEGLSGPRLLRVEDLESRRCMTADLSLGSVYFEPASGDDSEPNIIQITFEGGAPGTQLNRITIDTDKDGHGLSAGDLFFDTASGGLGVFGNSPLQIISHNGFQVTGVTSDGSSHLTFDLVGFDAGEKLVFSIDVDEVNYVDPDTGTMDVNAVVEGGEWQRSSIKGDFTAPHFYDASIKALYWDFFDTNFANAESSTGNHLQLPADRYDASNNDLVDRTAGAVGTLPQVPLPIMLSGTVFEDFNANNHQDPGDLGISSVTVSLQKWNGSSYVSTGLSTTTNGTGFYEFTNLLPGRYRVVETQPSGYLSVGAQAGTVDGTTRGSVENPDVITAVELLGGDNSIHNDFGEVRPAQISGNVNWTPTGNCEDGEEETPIEGVLIDLLDANGHVLQSTTTDAQGHYQFTGLVPGVYTVFEHQPVNFFDGDEHVGSAGGTLSNDRVSSITLGSGTNGVGYDFCEYPPSSLSGYVHDVTIFDCDDPQAPPIPSVTIHLLDGQGHILQTTTTDANGYYHFDNLPKGTYTIEEVQPAGFYSEDSDVGTVGGVAIDKDHIGSIVLIGGMVGLHYDFCEIRPSTISGYVHEDVNGNCETDAPDKAIAGVTLHLIDAQGNILATTQTNAQGYYEFTNLSPGTYGVVEEQPGAYLDGCEHVGTLGGSDAVNDHLTGIVLPGGTNAQQYNFLELKPVSISGYVRVSSNGDCEDPETTTPIAGVTIQLRDENGQVVATTLTDVNGYYQFINFPPGTYSVHEVQPNGYFQLDVHVGDLGGTTVDGDFDNIRDIILNSGDAGVHYDFCESPPATLSGYVFQDGPAIVLGTGQVLDVSTMRDGILTADDIRLAGVTLELRTFQNIPVTGDQALPGYYASGQPIRATTDANGFYIFRGLAAGNYMVVEVQPGGYIDSLDTQGSNDGIAINPKTAGAELAAIAQDINELSVASLNQDAITRIVLYPGDNAVFYNFSEVKTQPFFPPPPPPPNPPLPPPIPYTPPADPVLGFTPYPKLYSPPSLYFAGGPVPYTWHLSVVNGGQPRNNKIDQELTAQAHDSQHPQLVAFQKGNVRRGQWKLFKHHDQQNEQLKEVVFGMEDAIPITGDFNGDGITDVGVYVRGEWFIDLNGNGVWDEGDLWAHLGDQEDQPVTGDWDGDGKTDIGIYGPEWIRDERAIIREPGLPDPHNYRTNVAKNLPPKPEEATNGLRSLQRTANGKVRADLIDHVFRYGNDRDMAVSGDWNGDGIATIGTFRAGLWRLDSDGDGRLTERDAKITFGQAGDIPVVGDFDGDGVSEIGVYRNGIWYIDSNHNGQLDSGDQTIQQGSEGDRPVVGDWDGSGHSQIGTYSGTSGVSRQAARR